MEVSDSQHCYGYGIDSGTKKTSLSKEVEMARIGGLMPMGGYTGPETAD